MEKHYEDEETRKVMTSNPENTLEDYIEGMLPGSRARVEYQTLVEERDAASEELKRVKDYHAYRGLFDAQLEAGFEILKAILRGDEDAMKEWCVDREGGEEPAFKDCDEEECNKDCNLWHYLQLRKERDEARAQVESLEQEVDSHKRHAQTLGADWLEREVVRDRDAARKERDELRDRLEDWESSVKHVMDEPCGDEKHCTCVPVLRAEADKLRGVIATFREHVTTRSVDALADKAHAPLKDFADGWLQAKQEFIEALDCLDANPPECIRTEVEYAEDGVGRLMKVIYTPEGWSAGDSVLAFKLPKETP